MAFPSFLRFNLKFHGIPLEIWSSKQESKIWCINTLAVLVILLANARPCRFWHHQRVEVVTLKRSKKFCGILRCRVMGKTVTLRFLFIFIMLFFVLVSWFFLVLTIFYYVPLWFTMFYSYRNYILFWSHVMFKKKTIVISHHIYIYIVYRHYTQYLHSTIHTGDDWSFKVSVKELMRCYNLQVFMVSNDSCSLEDISKNCSLVTQPCRQDSDLMPLLLVIETLRNSEEAPKGWQELLGVGTEMDIWSFDPKLVTSPKIYQKISIIRNEAYRISLKRLFLSFQMCGSPGSPQVTIGDVRSYLQVRCAAMRSNHEILKHR